MIGGGPQKITVEIGGKIAASLGASLRGAQMQVSSFGRNVNRTMNDAATAGKKGFKNIFSNDLWQGAAAGAAGIGFALAGSVRVAASFENVLADIGKTANASQSELKTLSGEILRLSGRNITNLGPEKLAQGVQDLVAQGLELKDAVASMEALGKVATATNSDLLDVTKTGFQLQNALKIRPTELKATFDALAFAGKQGAFELRDMAQFMPTIASAAGDLGITGRKGAIELAAMMQMVRKNAPDSGQAATRLTDALMKMTAPDAVKNFKKFGVDIKQVMTDARKKGINPMEAAVGELQRITGGDIFKLSQIFGDKEAKLALMSLMKYRKEYAKLRDEAGGTIAAGTVDKDFERSLATFTGTLTSFQNVAQRLGIALGNALLPTLTAVAGAITPLVEGLAGFAQSNPVIATGIVTISGAFAGLVVVAPFVSSLISIVGALGGAITAAGGAGVVFGGIMAALTGPIGLTVLAIAGIGTALVAAYNRLGWFRSAVNGWASGVMQVFAGIGQFISNTWGLIVGVFTGDSAKIKTSFAGIGTAVQAILGGIGRGAQALWGGIVAGAGAVVRGIGAAFMAIPTVASNVFKGVLQVARLIFNQLPGPVRGAVRTVLGVLFPVPALIIRNWQGIVSGVRGIFNRVVAIIRETPQRVANVGSLVMQAIINGLKSKAGELFGWISGTWSRIKSFVGGGAEAPAAPGGAAPAAGGSSTYSGGQRSATPPGRASGGPVRAGFPYIVGERRRELFVPGMDGSIVPRIARPLTAAALSGLLATAPAAAQAPPVTINPPVPQQAPARAPITINAPVTINAAGGDAMEIRDQVRVAFEDLLARVYGDYRVTLND